MTTMLDRRGFCGALAGSAAYLASGAARAQAPTPGEFLFRNVRVFDGRASQLSGPTDVLVRGNTIAAVGTGGGAAAATVIDGAGRTLMPGLIDAHWHATLIALSPAETLTGDVGYAILLAADEARDTLLRGFTTVRDVGGPVFGLKRAIDQGVFPGPRFYPSGAMITVTSGHGDFRLQSDLPRQIGGPLTRGEQIGGFAIADSPDEVRVRTREQLMQGASQIKLTGGGGVSSPFSPIDVVTFTEPELRAAVEAARNWGTYVTVHAVTSEAIRIAVAAGAQCIEHGFLMTDDDAKLIAAKDIWLSLQPLPDEMRTGLPEGSVQRAKAEEVWPGIDRAYRLAKRYRLKTAWGSDILFSRTLASRQGAVLASLTRWYTPAEALIMATSTNAELLALSGRRNPYPGRLGVVEEGAYADLLLVNGNPLQDINLIADPARNFAIIMKDGVIHKNMVS